MPTFGAPPISNALNGRYRGQILGRLLLVAQLHCGKGLAKLDAEVRGPASCKLPSLSMSLECNAKRLAGILRRLRIGLAFIAALGSAVAPVYSHGFAHSGNPSSGGWVEVCTVGGMQRVLQDDPGTSKAPSDQTVHGQDCLYCASLASALGLPPSGKLGVSARASQASPIPLSFHHASVRLRPETNERIDRLGLQTLLQAKADEAQGRLGGDARVLARVLDLVPRLSTEKQAAGAAR